MPQRSGSLDFLDSRTVLAFLILVIGCASFYIGFSIGSAGGGTAAVPAVGLVVSPGAEAEDGIIALIGSANDSIDIEMYLFTNERLAYALSEAKGRGVAVRVILDRKVSGERIEEILSILSFNGIPVRRSSAEFETTHSKFAIIDRRIVLIGSHNWTHYAMERNREASVVLSDAALAQRLLQIFEADWAAAAAT